MELITKIKTYDFQKLFKLLGYSYFTKGCYNLNIIGVQNKNIIRDNEFDDFVIVEFRDYDGNWQRKIFKATTNPGLYYLKNPINFEGTAILVPGQYRGCWTFGKHQGKYDALVQYKPVRVYRDNNRDENLDFDGTSIKAGMFGINIHHAGTNSVKVDKWSAGCTVIANISDWYTFIGLCRLQESSGFGNKFTYTLLHEEDLDLVR